MNADATTMSRPEPAPPPRWRRISSMLLPPVLACAAVGAHFALNVPPGGVKVSDRDQGAAKKDPKAKKPKKSKKSFEPRPAGELDATWAQYEAVDFDAEPVKSAWARPHQSLINRAVTVARTDAFEGAPEEPRVSVEGVECRTIRCRFVLRGPFAHEVEMLSGTLSRLESGGEPLWRDFTTAKIDPPKPEQPKTDTYLRVTVAFREDSLDSASFRAPEDAIAGGAVGESDDERKAPPAPDDDDDDADENEDGR